MDYKKMREHMVESQIMNRGILNEKLLNIMKKVPRHVFVPGSLKPSAYDDNPIPIGYGQTISQPYMVALMTDLLELKGDEKVLEIGAGSGYQAAILSGLAKSLVTVERVKELADRTKKLLKHEGYDNVLVVHGDGTKGYEKEAPYDAVMITAATPKIPKDLFGQLADGGRLVAPVGPRYHQELIRVKKIENTLKKEYFGGCIFVPLIPDD